MEQSSNITIYQYIGKMPGYIDNSDIERVRDTTDIAEVVSGYITLKRKGQGDYWGQCPFHQESTASFHVRPDRGMYHCFGCGKGGNVFTFLMEMEGVSFAEAVRMLAERVGIELKITTGGKDAEKVRSHKDLLYHANTTAEAWFHGNLTKKNRSKEGTLAYEYLIERGMTPEIISKYKLGWAESSWDGLTRWAGQKGIKGSILAEVGLASQRKDKTGFVDRFRARIIFPIHNLSGKAIAFGGRVLENVTPDDDSAKYINSPETAVYRKGDNLYGLFTARESIRRSGIAYLVEGYTDLLALVQAWFINTAASLGTALTQNQARLLNRFASKVVVVYDSDEAGLSAARRSADVLTLAGLEARMVMLPEGDDPDSMLRRGGLELLTDTLKQDISFVDFNLKTSKPVGTDTAVGLSSSHAERLAVAQSLLNTIKAVKDPIQQDLLLKELEDSIGIRREVLQKAMQSIRILRYDQEEAVGQKKLQVSQDCIAERDLVRALLGHSELIGEILTDLQSDIFKHTSFKEIYRILERASLRGEGLDVTSLPERFNDPQVRAFIAEAIISREDVDVEIARNEIRGCIRALNLRELRARAVELEQDIQRTVKDGKPTRELMVRKVELDREMLELKSNG